MDAKLKETILNPIFKGNPITVLVLGICSYRGNRHLQPHPFPAP